MKIKKIITMLSATLILASVTAQETKKFNFWGSGEVFKLNPVTDSILLSTGLSLDAAWLICDKVVDINKKFDGNILNPAEVNPVDKLFMQPYSEPLDKIADVGMITGMATPLLLAFTPAEEWATILTMYAETVFIAQGIKELSKYAMSRPRPYMYFPGYNEKEVLNGEWAKSWPSGHSTLSFAGATFSSYVFSKYFPDSPWRFAVIGGTYAVAFTTAGLRMASGNHFLTDVLTGAALGTAIGFLVPWLHTFDIKKENSDGTSSQVSFSPLGVDVVFKL